MERKKLTKRMLERIEPVDKETWIMDTEIIGFGVRMRPNTKPVYAMRWKDATSRDRKLQIAPVSRVDLDGARAVARQRFGEIAGGENPLDTRKKEKSWTHTVSDVVGAVVEEMQTKGRAGSYIRDFQQQMRDHIEPAIGSMLVREVTTNDVDRILMKVRDRAALHNRVRAALSRVFKLAVRWRYRTDDPTMGTSPQPERHRERLLSQPEIDALLAALERHPGQSSDAMRLLYFTGSRPQELFSAKWGDLDLDVGVWIKPAQYVKQRRTHRVELHPVALAVFRRIREEAGQAAQPHEYVFPSSGQTGHLTTIKRHASKLFAEAGLADARPYDLRKAFASRLMASGADLRTVMSLTGHTQVAVLLKHYAQVMDGKQREALAKVFGSLVVPPEPAPALPDAASSS